VLVTGRAPDINALAFLGGISSDRFGFDDVLGLDSADLSAAQQANLRPRAYECWAAEAERPIYCKAHDACHRTPAGEWLFPPPVTRGAVYVVRDPRAVAVSLAHHAGRTIDDEIARMEDPAAAFSASPGGLSRQLRQHLGRWSEHVESWLAAPFPVHLVRYEDLHADPGRVCTKLAQFLDLPREPALIAAAVEATSFARLQAQERQAGFIERPETAAAFFREGRVDGWRAALTPAQSARIIVSHGPVMRRFGYDVAPPA
jgi:hypothetical protein